MFHLENEFPGHFQAFKKENAIFAENPFVYNFDKKQNIGNPILYYQREGKLPIIAIDPPEVKLGREQACNNPGPFAIPHGFDSVTCPVASIGHPNSLGATAYARIINEILERIHFLHATNQRNIGSNKLDRQ